MSASISDRESRGPSAIHIEQVQLNLLAPDPDQIRKHFDQEALESLAGSIKAQGLIQPIVVRPAGEGGALSIIAGERRYRAAKLAGIQDIPVIVREDLVGTDIAVIQVIENLQREDLSLAETCDGVARLVEAVGFQKTCEQLGKSEAWVSKHSGVVKLPDAIKKLVGDGKIASVDVAKELGTLMELAPKKADAIIQRIDPHVRAADAGPGDDEDLDAEDVDSADRVWTGRGYKNRAELTEEECELLELNRSRGPYVPTRREIRLEVLTAKADAQRKADEKAARNAEKAAIKNDPAAAKRAAAEKNKEDKAAAKRKAVKLANELCREFATEITIALNVGAGFQAPKRGTYNWVGHYPVINVEPPGFYEGMTGMPPTSPDVVTFDIGVAGTFDQMKAANALIGITPKLDFDVDAMRQEPLTIIEAKKIADILGSRAKFLCRVSRKGGALQLIADGHKQEPSGKGKGGAAEATVPAFLAARVKKATIPSRRIKAADLHAAYTDWCKPLKHKPVPINATAWGAAIEAAGIEKIRSNGFQYVGIEMVKS